LNFIGRTDNEKGIALFLVLWVLTLLSVIVGEFCHTMRTELNIARNFKEQTQAYYLAAAGVNVAIRELIKNTVMPRETKPSDDKAQEEKTEWRANTDIPAISFGGGTFKVEIGNESGKININRAGEHLLRMMISHFDIEDSDKDIIMDSILDWRDTDTLHRVNGAEDDYYLSLSPPYECKDADFDSIEELRQVKGITSEIFESLKEIVTVYVDTDSEGSPNNDKKQFDFNKININAASPQVLKSLPGMTDEMLQEIIAHREKEDFNSLTELVPLLDPEIYSGITEYLSVEMSPLFTIRSVGTLEDSRTQEGVKVLIKIDRSLEKKYRILRWTDALEYSIDFQIRQGMSPTCPYDV